MYNWYTTIGDVNIRGTHDALEVSIKDIEKN